MTAVLRAHGYKSTCKANLDKVRAACPDVDERLGGGKHTTKAKAATAKPRKPGKKAAPKTYPRSEHNPFRESSAYAACYDILAYHGENGVERGRLVDELSRLMPRKEGESDADHRRRAYFNVTVIASSRKDGKSHRCIAKAADGFFVERENSHLVLRLRDRKY